MEKFSDLRKIRESKDSIINRMTQLTDEQKSKAKAFFNKYNAYENEVDWNKWRTLTWEDLSAVINKDRSKASNSQVKKSIRKGLEGFKEGEDYEILDEGEFNDEPYVAYLPRNWEASRMIASTSVEPCDTEAKWCTAYQKTSEFWESHNRHERFIYYCGEGIPTKKVAVSIEIGKNEHDANDVSYSWSTYDNIYTKYNLWDSYDDKYRVGSDEMPSNMSGLIEKVKLRFEDEAETTPREEAVSRFGEEGEYIVDAWENVFYDGDYDKIEEYYIGAYDSDEAFFADMVSEDKWEDIVKYIDLRGFSSELVDDTWADDPEDFEAIWGVTQEQYDSLDLEEILKCTSEYLEGCGESYSEMFTGFLKDYVNALEYMEDHSLDGFNGYYFYNSI